MQCNFIHLLTDQTKLRALALSYMTSRGQYWLTIKLKSRSTLCQGFL